MTVSVILEGTLKDEEIEKFTGICKEAFEVTRAFDGCQGIDLTYNTENPKNWNFWVYFGDVFYIICYDLMEKWKFSKPQRGSLYRVCN